MPASWSMRVNLLRRWVAATSLRPRVIAAAIFMA